KLIELIENDLSQFQSPPQLSMPLPDIWIVKSLLQKAIRRNDLAQALRATQFAIELDRKSFWRRLPIIAWEDVGIADINLCNSVCMLARSKRLRSKIGHEWLVASYLVTKLCAAPKDRSSDDLLTVIEHDQDLKPARDRLAFAESEEREALLNGGSGPLQYRAIALHYALGTDRLRSDLLHRKSADGEHLSILQSIAGCPFDLANICADSTKRTGTILPAFSAMLWRGWIGQQTGKSSQSDDFGHQYEIASIPRYAFDGNTRTGRKYLHWLASIDDGLSHYLKSNVPKPIRRPLVRKLYFRLKSSLCANREYWSDGCDLRHRADQIGYGLPTDAIDEGKRLLAIAMLQYPMAEEHL
ncbi:MAG: hypothetical protein AB8B54_11460, partial [Sphingorhabdus sp.]